MTGGRSCASPPFQWLARSGESFKGGGGLWAADDERNTVLEMSDIRQDGPPNA